MQSLGQISIVVREYDEAIRFYVDALGFELIEDTPRKRALSSFASRKKRSTAPSRSSRTFMATYGI